MDIKQLGFQASEILQSHAYKASFDRLEQSIVSKIKACKFDGSDDDYLSKLNMLLHLHETHKRIFAEMISSGKLAEDSLNRKTVFNRTGI